MAGTLPRAARRARASAAAALIMDARGAPTEREEKALLLDALRHLAIAVGGAHEYVPPDEAADLPPLIVN